MEEDLIFEYNDVINSIETATDFLDKFYSFMVRKDISNMYLASSDYIVIDRNKHKVVITKFKISKTSMEYIVRAMTGGETSLGSIFSGQSLDRSADVRVDGTRARTRINISAIFHLETNGIQITIRKIDFLPPALDKIGFTPTDERYLNFFAEQGLSIVTGPTGSGKSTTLASFIQHYCLDDNHVIVNTYEEPIEYIHDNVNNNSTTSRIYQTEIPTQMPSFHEALKKSLRRQPEIIMIGELRDPETISAALEAGLTGHLVISTTHTNGVPATIRRLITVFDSAERDGRQTDLIEQLNIILAQRLLRTVDGKKIAVREHLIFDQQVKNRLQGINPLLINIETRKIMIEKKIGMLFEAKALYDKGIIDFKEYSKIGKLYKEEYKKAQTGLENDDKE